MATPWPLRDYSSGGYSVATPWLLRAYSVAAVAATAVATPWLLRCCGYLLTYSVATPWRLRAYSVATRLTQWLLGYSLWLLPVATPCVTTESPGDEPQAEGERNGHNFLNSLNIVG